VVVVGSHAAGVLELTRAFRRMECPVNGLATVAALFDHVQASVDLVLVDLADAPPGAFEAALKLRADQRARCVVAVTAAPRADLRADALRRGADDVVSRPVELDELFARIHALLRRLRRHSGVMAAVVNVPAERNARWPDLIAQIERARREIDATVKHRQRRLLALFEGSGGRLVSWELAAAQALDAPRMSQAAFYKQVRRLNEKLAEFGMVVVAERGLGWYLDRLEPR
jgi:DNA-binding response OmpR family regulator